MLYRLLGNTKLYCIRFFLFLYTWICHILHQSVSDEGHVTEQWENSKSSKNTGRTVDNGNKQGISKIKKHRVTNTSDIVGYNEIYALEKVQLILKSHRRVLFLNLL